VLRVIDMCYVYAARLAAFATSAFGTRKKISVRTMNRKIRFTIKKTKETNKIGF